MESDLMELTNNIQAITAKLRRLDEFLQGITVGMGVLLVIMVVIMIKLIAG